MRSPTKKAFCGHVIRCINRKKNKSFQYQKKKSQLLPFVPDNMKRTPEKNRKCKKKKEEPLISFLQTFSHVTRHQFPSFCFSTSELLVNYREGLTTPAACARPAGGSTPLNELQRDNNSPLCDGRGQHQQRVSHSDQETLYSRVQWPTSPPQALSAPVNQLTGCQRCPLMNELSRTTGVRIRDSRKYIQIKTCSSHMTVFGGKWCDYLFVDF